MEAGNENLEICRIVPTACHGRRSNRRNRRNGHQPRIRPGRALRLADSFLFAQWRPLVGDVQPYVEARAGFHYLWTQSKLEDQDWWNDEQVARETNLISYELGVVLTF